MVPFLRYWNFAPGVVFVLYIKALLTHGFWDCIYESSLRIYL